MAEVVLMELILPDEEAPVIKPPPPPPNEEAPINPKKEVEEEEALRGVDDEGYREAFRRRLMLGLLIGVITGLMGTAYRLLFESALLVWRYPGVPPAMLTTAFGFAVGLSLRAMGQPTANLPGLVHHFHANKGYLSCSVFRTFRIAIVSTLSIAGAGSLGPEAPLVSMGGGAASYAWQRLGHPDDTTVATLCGMAAGLGAFFGDPVGGAFFALEVVHRHGLEFWEAIVPAIFASIASHLVYRASAPSLCWHFPAAETTSVYVCFLGVATGLAGGAIGSLWIRALRVLKRFELPTVSKATLGGLLIGALGSTAPSTLFWGEHEINALLGGDLPRVDLPSPDSPRALIYAGFVKLVLILVTVLAGYRGGFIFPFMFSGIAIGAGVARLLGLTVVAHVALSLAAAINTAATRTVFATPFVLVTLSNRPDTLLTCLVASVVSLVLTADVAVITDARARWD
ncbi:hypothetical protein CTAYLR_005302 [Chrysophaeum taylorii]|uniref:Chloride channel protein n=1 Tax=Chrysophaeum taylorii TaxID=2483200 RepID=A0AAD7XS92_9STRA|nr:hypothetical protein CTAYLR_005302 [Chrysophaeum taylorii]